jgi:hypothetical protein
VERWDGNAFIFACLSFDLRADLEVELEFPSRGIVMTMIGEELCIDLGLY